MMYSKVFKKIISPAVIALFAVTVICCDNIPAVAGSDISDDDFDKILGTYSVDPSVPSYKEYLSSYDPVFPDETISIDTGLLYTDEGSHIDLDFTVDEPGFYYPRIKYCPVGGRNSQMQRSFFIDGKLPYAELSLTNFSRIWVTDVNETYVDENGIALKKWKSDNQGFHLKPGVMEEPGWCETYLYDSCGYITAPLSVYLDAGEHTLTIYAGREPMLIEGIDLTSYCAPPGYSDYHSAFLDYSSCTGQYVRIEAENASKTSSQMLYPRQDQSSPAVYPSSPKLLLNNTIGGTSWQSAGQWIEWEFDIPEDGFYNISAFCKQNFVRGTKSCRRISIDGEVPFEEMSDYGFEYSQSWREEVLSSGDGDPYSFYLTKGHHTIRMEVVLGDMAEIISLVQDTVMQLNNIYRSVIYITGVSPDPYRDYQIAKSLPGLNAQLIQARDELDIAITKLELTAGNNSDKLNVLRTMQDQLDDLIEDEERFTKVISSYKKNVRACGNWITRVLPQPLQIDRIMLYTEGGHRDITGNTWHDKAGYELSRLYYSFVIDYNSIGNVSEDSESNVTLTLWVGTGRDQANVVKSLIDENFTPETNINVNVQLVDMSTLLRASLAGEGPDVAIQVANSSGIAGAVLNTGNDTPVNYGLRNAVLDLSRFEDYESVKRRFSESASVPFTFNGSAYALPETQTFPMMFYRKDILAEIGLDVPETWDDVKVAMTVLAKNQMEFGMLPSEQVFAMLLFQNGGKYYTDNGDASALDSDISAAVFREYCEYYTDYKLDKATSVEERFRTGECPIIIADYTTYNILQVSAPDIEGLWDFTVVPGVRGSDGKVNHTTGSTGLADIIMSSTDHPAESWEFLKWWTSAETQTLYGREMESLMGASARVATANLEALSNLSWPRADYEVLLEQFKQVQGIPQVPGGYYTWRNVNNAFYTVTTDSSLTGRSDYAVTPREELMDKVLYINAEIDYKREEFGLPLAAR